jgi:3-(3-hydroxy-phenyl)propionate hydroxylase
VTGPDDTEVLVVGAGPVGLFAACELLRRGVRVRLVDRSPAPADQPRALALWPRAVDILADLGIGERLARASIPVAGFRYYSLGKPLADFPIQPQLRARHLPQPETERLLTERLHELGGKVEHGVRLLDFDDLDFGGGIDATDGVTAVLTHGDSGLQRVRARFVIGADGASSIVRRLIGAGFEGSTYELAFALIDARVDGELPADRLLYYQAPTGTLMIAPLPDRVFRILAVIPGGAPAGHRVTVPAMQELLDERGPGGVTITEPVWQTVYRVHARQATEYQRGRVFLAGDAAHVHSPAGGQGMNNGIQDAYNLAWKLTAVLRGDSPSALLADYTDERRTATDRIIADTDRQTRAWMANTPARITVRDAAFRLADRTGLVPRYVFPVMAGRRVRYEPVRDTQSPAGRTACQLLGRTPGRLRPGMVFPRELALAHGFAGPAAQPSGWTLAVVPPALKAAAWSERLDAVTDGRAVRTVRLPRAATLSATGCGRAGYHLVRPDGHIAAHGHLDDLDRLAAELDRVLPRKGRPLKKGAAS